MRRLSVSVNFCMVGTGDVDREDWVGTYDTGFDSVSLELTAAF